MPAAPRRPGRRRHRRPRRCARGARRRPRPVGPGWWTGTWASHLRCRDVGPCNVCCNDDVERTLCSMRDLATRITEAASTLSPAARRVAEVVLADPSAAAFATVAEVGARAHTSGATVVRLAERLGYDGWVDLQAEARARVDQQLRPAAQRIRETAAGDVLGATATREADNVHRTLADVDRTAFDRAVALLADRRRPVRVIAGDAEAGIGSLLVDALDLLRPDVLLISGSPVSATRRLATGERDVVVAIDLRRYERWVLDAIATATPAGAEGHAPPNPPPSPP